MDEKRNLLIRKIVVIALVVLPLIGSIIAFVCMEIANGKEHVMP